MSSRIVVAVVHNLYSARAPSGENVVVRLQEDALRDAGLVVHPIHVETDYLARKRFYQMRVGFTVSTGRGWDPSPWLHELRPDLIHIHNLFPNIDTRWLAGWKGPIIATVHNYRPMCAAGTMSRNGQYCRDCLDARIPWPAMAHRCYRGSLITTLPMAIATGGGVRGDRLLNRADRIVMLSPRAFSEYESAGLDRLERVRIVPNFVEPNAGALVNTDRTTAPWVFAGRLSEEKGLLKLLDYWPSGERIVIFGDGPQRALVEKFATGAVEFRGPISREVLIANLASFRGLILPSLFAEGIPTVYLEALAAGLPTVAYEGNSAADDIRKFKTGSIFGDFSDLPSALAEVEVDRMTLSNSCVNRFRARYSLDAWRQSMLSVYEELVSR